MHHDTNLALVFIFSTNNLEALCKPLQSADIMTFKRIMVQVQRSFFLVSPKSHIGIIQYAKAYAIHGSCTPILSQFTVDFVLTSAVTVKF